MRIKLTVACALTAFIAVGGGTAEATGLTHTRTIAHGTVASQKAPAQTQKATHGIERSRGGKALTEKEYWRAQWRDEGAVFPGDK